MRKSLGIVLLVIFVTSIIGTIACRDDVFVEPPPSLTGDYYGWYSYKPDNQAAVEQPVTWRFSSNSYSMYYDIDSDPDSSRVFCDVQGSYELGNGVELIQERENLTQQNCNTDLNPTGFFQLDQSTDTLKMTQYDDQLNVTRTIRLLNELQ